MRETAERHREGRKPWEAAATMADLCELTARWCEGGITYHPNGHSDGPDEETHLMGAELAALNRAGFLTDNSQAGESYPYGSWTAWVRGFAPADLADRIAAAAPPHVQVTIYRPPHPRGHGSAFGMYDHPNGKDAPARFTRAYVRDLEYPEVPAAALDEVLACCQVHIEDTRPGVNNMWSDWLVPAATDPGDPSPPPGSVTYRPQTPAATPPPATPTGGNSMSVLEVRSHLTGAYQMLPIGPLKAASAELEQIAGHLAQTLEGSNDAEAEAAVNLVRQVQHEIDSLAQKLMHARDQLGTYAGRI